MNQFDTTTPETTEHLRKIFCTGAIMGAWLARRSDERRDALMTLDLATLERVACALAPSDDPQLPWHDASDPVANTFEDILAKCPAAQITARSVSPEERSIWTGIYITRFHNFSDFKATLRGWAGMHFPGEGREVHVKYKVSTERLPQAMAGEFLFRGSDK